jgi:hypothetical protein
MLTAAAMLVMRRSDGGRAVQKGSMVFIGPTVLLILYLLAYPYPTYGAFELKPLPPAGKGTATHLVGYVASDGVLVGDTQEYGRLGLRSVQVYGFKPFGLDEISFVAASAEVSLWHDLEMFLAYQALSALSYVEETYKLSCRYATGRIRLEPTVRIGTVRFENSVVDHALLFDITCYTRLHPDIGILIGARNPFGVGLVRAGEKCPAEISAGLGYNVCTRFSFGVELSKEPAFPTAIATGVEMQLAGGVKLRSGIRSHPKEFCMGLGLCLGRIALDMSASLNLDLGVTHAAGLTYRRD